jgi:hypothetical protein
VENICPALLAVPLALFRVNGNIARHTFSREALGPNCPSFPVYDWISNKHRRREWMNEVVEFVLGRSSLDTVDSFEGCGMEDGDLAGT